MIEVRCWNCGEMKRLQNGKISCSAECASSILKSDLYKEINDPNYKLYKEVKEDE